MQGLIKELKRRNVFRVSVAYLVIGWVVLEAASIVAPALRLPDWTVTLLLFIGICGFPFAILFAWAFELTPGGIMRTGDVHEGASITTVTASRLNYLIIGLLIAALALVLIARPLIPQNSPSAETSTTAQAQSIAVLPFVNMSEDKANEHFGDGLAEELLNQLAQVPELQVAARTSSFYFKDKNPTFQEVASALQVDTILEGSVRRYEDTIRVTAQLIETKNGTHLWSAKYDRPFTDLFKVQDDIAQKILESLLPHLDVDKQLLTNSGSKNISPEQFEQFLIARHRYYEETDDSRDIAHTEFLALTKSSPGYAPAWSWLARSWLSLPNTSFEVSKASAQKALDTALRLNPGDTMALRVQGDIWRQKREYEKAMDYYARALASDPANVDALLGRHHALVWQGRTDEAITVLQEARGLDPLHPDVLWELGHLLNLQGHKREAFEAVDRLYKVNTPLAARLENHMYSDGMDEAAVLYSTELDLNSKPNYLPKENYPFWLLAMDIQSPSVIADSGLYAVSLARDGQTELALSTLEAELSQRKNAADRLITKMLVYTAMGDFITLAETGWDYWQSLESQTLSNEFYFWHAYHLAAGLYMTGQQDKLDLLLPILIEDSANHSPLHNGGYRIWRARLAQLRGQTVEAIELYQSLADEGYPGNRIYGSPIRFGFLDDGDPRYQAVREKLDTNREKQLARLEQFRSNQLSAEGLREAYIAR